MTESPPEESATYFEEDPCSNPDPRRAIGSVIADRIDRRKMLKAAAFVVAAGFVRPHDKAAGEKPASVADSGPSSLTFVEIAHGRDTSAHVAAGYEIQVLLRWGDRVLHDAPDHDPYTQTAAAQAKQFGYNCDYIAYLPLPAVKGEMNRGLLCVNHEYTDTNLMFPGIEELSDLEKLPRAMVDVELTAHGHSVVEVAQTAAGWQVVADSRLNRRITGMNTEMRLAGPAAGDPRLRTHEDPTGTRVIGTLNNCAGGVTPWGTVLICEENFNNYFSAGELVSDETPTHRRYGIEGASRFYPAWAKHYRRFNVDQEPNEPNRFGWVVEFDPYDSNSMPVKRTALGRLKHEGAGVVVNHDDRVILYCGDDERFDYVYRFVSRRPYNPEDRAANKDLLDEGTLFVARFGSDGTGRWLPLTFGKGPLTAANGFHSQADVLIETRRAADLLEATPMDRPEDVEVLPESGHVFVILTNNTRRTADATDAANPRPENAHGHILELIPPAVAGQVDHAATEFRWEIFLKAGNPAISQDDAQYHPHTSADGWFSSPDNAAFDSAGRMWLTTDSDHELTGFGDGVYACDTSGPGRALPKLFFRGPRGAEVSGVCFTPDNKTLFVSVQHPGEEQGSTFTHPSTRWPDHQLGIPPKPAVVAITRSRGGPIGD